MFDKYDKDGSGFIDNRELHLLCYDQGNFALTKTELAKVRHIMPFPSVGCLVRSL